MIKQVADIFENRMVSGGYVVNPDIFVDGLRQSDVENRPIFGRFRLYHAVRTSILNFRYLESSHIGKR